MNKSVTKQRFLKNKQKQDRTKKRNSRKCMQVFNSFKKTNNANEIVK